VTKIEFAHPIQRIARALLMEALSATDEAFIDVIVHQLVGAAARGGTIDMLRLNSMLSTVMSVKPKDQLEAMLAVQMAATHTMSMECAGGFANAQGLQLQLQEAGERTFTRLSRTYVMQMEALKRYRTKGEQNVTVNYVSIAKPDKMEEDAARSPPALTYSKTSPMPVLGEKKDLLPIDRNETSKKRNDGRS
jgi:hypothetical protein